MGPSVLRLANQTVETELKTQTKENEVNNLEIVGLDTKENKVDRPELVEFSASVQDLDVVHSTEVKSLNEWEKTKHEANNQINEPEIQTFKSENKNYINKKEVNASLSEEYDHEHEYEFRETPYSFPNAPKEELLSDIKIDASSNYFVPPLYPLGDWFTLQRAELEMKQHQKEGKPQETKVEEKKGVYDSEDEIQVENKKDGLEEPEILNFEIDGNNAHDKEKDDRDNDMLNHSFEEPIEKYASQDDDECSNTDDITELLVSTPVLLLLTNFK